MSKLAALYQQLVKDATHLPNQDHAHTLRNGARMAVRIRDGLHTVTFSRGDVLLGEVEIDTFMAHCGVPSHARRIPTDGQGFRADGLRGRHYVAFQWPVAPETQQALALLPGARNAGDELFPEDASE